MASPCTPLLAGHLQGLRTWAVLERDGEERLAAPHRGTLWPQGGEPVHARCEEFDHPAPAPGCHCGVHAWHPRSDTARRVLQSRREVAGFVEAWGALEVHADGFRAEHARVHALVLPRGGHAARIRRLAAAHGALVLEVDGAAALLAHSRTHRLGLDERTVEAMLGPQLAEERVRRRDQSRRRAGRAFAITALLGALAIPAWPVIEDLATTKPSKPVSGRAPALR